MPPFSIGVENWRSLPQDAKNVLLQYSKPWQPSPSPVWPMSRRLRRETSHKPFFQEVKDGAPGVSIFDFD
jgi:hypothetical protein